MNYHYFAFISYSHKDKKWAEWIQRSIEHYRLPAIIRKEVQKQLPKKIAPVFRDATDLGVDVLVDGLHEELEKSRFLIVVCSPNSAKPNAEGKHFVDEEVRHFCELGRTKEIIPVIIEGTPEESFGPVLKSKEILALDATKQSRARILNDIVAKILGLKPDALWRRAERERKKRLVVKSIMCGILGLAAVFIGLFAWDANRTVKNYYADYVDSFGLPEGIFPLKKSELTHRYVHYRFEYKGFQYGKSPHADSADWCIWNMFGFRRRLVRVVQANSRGYPRKWEHTEYSDRPLIQDFEYDRGLRLRQIQYGRYNGEGRKPRLVKTIELFSTGGETNNIVRFFRNGDRTIAFADPIDSDDPKSAVPQHQIKRDALGRGVQCLFLNVAGGYTLDSDGMAGFAYEYDELGRKTCRRYVFIMGIGENSKGVAGHKYSYRGNRLYSVTAINKKDEAVVDGDGSIICKAVEFDKHGNLLCERFVDASDNLLPNANGVAIVRCKYDSCGDVVSTAFFDIDDKPTLSNEGIARLDGVYDSYGNVLEQKCFGENGKPIISNRGFASVKYLYDESGNPTYAAFYDADGLPICHEDGNSAIQAEYDEAGNMIRQVFLDDFGHPVMTKNGYAEVRLSYDDNGNQTNYLYLGTNNNPIICKDGYAERRITYTITGLIASESFWDTDGRQTLNENGVSEVRREYSSIGKLEWLRYYDTSGHPVASKEGMAKIHRLYTDLGQLRKEEYFGVDGHPVYSNKGNARWESEFDSFGRETRKLYLGCDNEPIIISDGYAEIRCAYVDSLKTPVETAYFDEKGFPSCDTNGISKIKRELNDKGLCAREEYYGQDGMPTVGIGGYFSASFAYDAHGRPIREEYFDEHGSPTFDNTGCAKEEYSYDKQGNLASRFFYDTQGNPTVNSADGVAGFVWEYDNRGNRIRQSHIGLDGLLMNDNNGVAGGVVEYDTMGRLSRIFAFDAQTNMTVRAEEGAVGYYIKHDERGREKERGYFDVDGLPSICNDGYAKVSYEYDERGNPCKLLYYGIDGGPTASSEGIAGILREYDKFGNVIKSKYIDESGVPIVHNDGNVGWKVELDAYGRETRRVFFDANEKPIALADGVAEVHYEYNEQGKMVLASYFGADGHPCLNVNGIAGIKRTVDRRGLCRGEYYFDTEGEPVLHRDGFIGWEAEYDSKGHETSRIWLGKDKKPVSNQFGYAMQTQKYDNRGNCIEMLYLDANGVLTMNVTDGVAGFRWEYDNRNRKTRQYHVGVDGKLTKDKYGVFAGGLDYDHKGRLIKIYALDESNKLTVRSAEGAAGWSMCYDEKNREVQRTYFGVDGCPVVTTEGLAIKKMTYDDKGRETSCAWYDADGCVIVQDAAHGIAWVQRAFDNRGREIKRRFFGADGKPTLNDDGIAGGNMYYDNGNMPTRMTFFNLQEFRCANKKGVAELLMEYDEDGNLSNVKRIDIQGNEIR